MGAQEALNLAMGKGTTRRPQTLYNLQDTLIEHRFPNNYCGVPEYSISNAGDVYRELAKSLTVGFWDGGYISGKLSALDYEWTVGDLIEIHPMPTDAAVMEQINVFDNNLRTLYRATQARAFDTTKKHVMLKCLDMIKKISDFIKEPSESAMRILNYEKHRFVVDIRSRLARLR